MGLVNWRRWTVWTAAVGLAFSAGTIPCPAQEKAPRTPKIQMAILLDTSNSMDGLINQARTQLWAVVQEFTTLKLAGHQPQLEVALFEYGNTSLPAAEGFIRLVLPLTGDLDKISEAMWALRTNGGDEFCGQVIDRAVRSLTWSTSSKDVKCIFIAGNEPFTQGTFEYTKACQAAANHGITVNTIFCGPAQEGIATKWEDGAKLADGKYLHIDQNQVDVAVSTPQDAEINRLGLELNQTYLAYGSRRRQEEVLTRQVAQDANASSAATGIAVSRAAVKASQFYRNADWDLIDALEGKQVKLEELKAEDLPEALRGKSLAEQRQIVDVKASQRKDIQEKIRKLNDARQTHLAAARKQMAAEAEAAGQPAPAAAFSRAVVEAVVEQAGKK